MRKISVSVAVAGALLLGLGSSSAEPPNGCPPAVAQDTDISVYRAALAHPSVLDDKAKKRGLVVVREMSPERSSFSVSDRGAGYFRRFLRQPDPALIADFLCAATGRGVVPKALARDRDVQLVSEDELQRTLERPGVDFWRAFTRRYPRAAGLVTLSPVAYSADGTAAMVHVTFAGGLLNAHGEAVVLRLVNGAWNVVDHVHTWES